MQECQFAFAKMKFHKGSHAVDVQGRFLEPSVDELVLKSLLIKTGTKSPTSSFMNEHLDITVYCCKIASKCLMVAEITRKHCCYQFLRHPLQTRAEWLIIGAIKSTTRMVQLPATAAIEYVAACLPGATYSPGVFWPGDFCPGGLCPSPPKFNAYTNRLGFLCLPSQSDGQTKNKQTNKKRQTRSRSSAGSRPPLPKFAGYVQVEAHYIFHPSTIWVRRLFTELGPKKNQKADFAMKQTNICRLSGDIKIQIACSEWQSVRACRSCNSRLLQLLRTPFPGPQYIRTCFDKIS